MCPAVFGSMTNVSMFKCGGGEARMQLLDKVAKLQWDKSHKNRNAKNDGNGKRPKTKYNQNSKN